MLCGTEQLIGSLPEVKWAQQVRSLATQLQEESLHVIVQHLPDVIRTQAFQELRRVRGCWSWCLCSLLYCNKHIQLRFYVFSQREEVTREPTLLKKLCSAIREGASVDNCCDLFAAVYLLCGDDGEEDSLLQQGGRKQEEVKWINFSVFQKWTAYLGCAHTCLLCGFHFFPDSVVYWENELRNHGLLTIFCHRFEQLFTTTRKGKWGSTPKHSAV